MSDPVVVFGAAWGLSEALSLVMLVLGMRMADHPHLLRIGAIAHRQKLRALATVWPLTRLPAAVERGDTAWCTVILSSLIALKSAASFVFGIVVVVWLPIASLVVPAIVAVHDPDDPTLGPWVRTVAMLQVTSHTLAAALGFALVVTGPMSDGSIMATVTEHARLGAVVLAASLLFALAAGHAEAVGVVRRGL